MEKQKEYWKMRDPRETGGGGIWDWRRTKGHKGTNSSVRRDKSHVHVAAHLFLLLSVQ